MNKRMSAALVVVGWLVASLPAQQPTTPKTGAPSAGIFGGAPTKPGTGGSGGGNPMGGTPGLGMPMGGGSGMMSGKEKDIKAMTLEELLAKALKDNPDIHVAESKIREAEAQLNRIRLQTLQMISKHYQEIVVAREMVRAATKLQSLLDVPTSSIKERIEAQNTVDRAKADLAKLEAELPYLVGKQPLTVTRTQRYNTFLNTMMEVEGVADLLIAPAAKQPPASLADKLRKALDTEVTLRQSEMTLHDAVSFLSDKMQGVNVHIADKKLNETKLNLYLRQPVALGAVFQYFEDELNCLCVVREYGIVIVPRERVPPSAAPLVEFWKKSRSTESKPK